MENTEQEQKKVRISATTKTAHTISVLSQQLLLGLIVKAIIDQLRKLFRHVETVGGEIIMVSESHHQVQVTVRRTDIRDLGWVDGGVEADFIKLIDEVNFGLASVNAGAEAAARAMGDGVTHCRLRVISTKDPDSMPFIDTEGNVVVTKDPRPIVRRLWPILQAVANAQQQGLDVSFEIGDSTRTFRNVAENALLTEFVPCGENVVHAKLLGYLPRRRVAEFRSDDKDMEMKVPAGCEAILRKAQQTGALLRLKLEVSTVSNPALPSENRDAVLEVEEAMKQLEL
jgi:hypothetical protein